MMELPLVFVGGLLGSSHCVGMCGGFALLLGAGARGWGTVFARQLLYSAGRLFTYATIGGLLGYTGLRLVAGLSPVIEVQAWLSIAAGALLIVQGLFATGVLRRRPGQLAARLCPAADVLKSTLAARSGLGFFLAGVATGFLPCGLLYAYFALATAAGGLWQGSAVMAAFGLGTMPLMIAAGAGGSLLSLDRRRRLLRVAAWCVVLTGGITLARGVSFLSSDHASGPPTCPLCETKSVARR